MLMFTHMFTYMFTHMYPDGPIENKPSIIQVMVRCLTQICVKRDFFYKQRFVNPALGLDMDKYDFIVKQWDAFTRACSQSNVKVKDVNKG